MTLLPYEDKRIDILKGQNSLMRWWCKRKNLCRWKNKVFDDGLISLVERELGCNYFVKESVCPNWEGGHDSLLHVSCIRPRITIVRLVKAMMKEWDWRMVKALLMIIHVWWSHEQDLVVLRSADAEFGATWEVGKGSFRRILFGYYDDLSNIRIVVDPRFYASILIVRTNILEFWY